MGGLRAVVVTDVIQTLILFGGAILTLILVTVYLGGVGNWWPSAVPRTGPRSMDQLGRPRVDRRGDGRPFHLVDLHRRLRPDGHPTLPRHARRQDGARRAGHVALGQRVRGADSRGVGLALLAYFRRTPTSSPTDRPSSPTPTSCSRGSSSSACPPASADWSWRVCWRRRCRVSRPA